ncbi:MAG: lipopolysaccharide heptosyltransferase II [Methylococcales symbiont of Hymedesmia sp. n. MRB-2018]|nr:MAG: lipopolysaccharide heptosyltransferase II [Methylococcales symbiont of Hymedesmia sp. n. MRB-2018]
MSALSHKILVVGPSWVGDMVMAQSLFMTLKKNNRHCQIDVLAPQWSFSLLDRMPEVEKGIAMPMGHGKLGLKTRLDLGKSLKPSNYDQAILLPNSLKSALTPFFANIPLRTGYIGECRWGLLNDARKLNKNLLTMTVQRFVALGLAKNRSFPEQFPIPKLAIEPAKQKAVCKQFRLTVNNKILALCPGAEYGPAKRWPVSHYAEIAQQKIKQGWQVWIFGSVKDVAVAEQINVASEGLCTDFTGKTSMAEAVDLMSLVDTVVTNDSGLMHVAAALDKNIVAIYGSSDPGFTPPLHNKAKVIYLNLSCSPCFKRECPLGHSDCLNNIKPDQVLESIH